MVSSLRLALASHLGKTLTPEVAAAIELACNPDRSIDVLQFPSEYRGDVMFSMERLADVVDELTPLHQAHWDETEHARHGLTMSFNVPAALQREREGGLAQFTMRGGHGELVGHIRMYLYTSMHTQTLAAKEDTIYVLPSHRKGFTAVRFWQYMERCLKELGVREIYTDSKLVNKVARFNEYLGYTHVSNGFLKFIKE